MAHMTLLPFRLSSIGFLCRRQLTRSFAAIALFAILDPAMSFAYSGNLLSYTFSDDTGFVHGAADFSDPAIDVSEFQQGTGTVTHNGTALSFISPGVVNVAPPPISSELSYFMTPVALVTGSTATLETLWEPPSLALGDSIYVNALNLDLATGDLAEAVRIEITNRTSLAAAEFGQAAGLNMAILYAAPGSGIEEVYDIALGSMPTGDVLFRVAYNSSAGTLDALISLDGGITIDHQRSFASVAGPGGFGALVAQVGAGNVVPEPSTSVLILLGLAVLARRVP